MEQRFDRFCVGLSDRGKKKPSKNSQKEMEKEKSLLEGAEKTRAGARAGGGERKSIRKRRKRTRAQT